MVKEFSPFLSLQLSSRVIGRISFLAVYNVTVLPTKHKTNSKPLRYEFDRA